MIHVPHAGDAFDEQGVPSENPKRWNKYADRTFSQLEWWAEAARNQRALQDPFSQSPAFQKTPDQRNAPS